MSENKKAEIVSALEDHILGLIKKCKNADSTAANIAPTIPATIDSYIKLRQTL